MGTLFIVATPIGNLEDISLRALKTLFGVHSIACEDTRRTGLLLQELGKRHPNLHLGGVKLIRYDDRTERNAAAEILELLSQGQSVALVSDAGTPRISDPGYVLVKEARLRNVPVISIPGASALLVALTSSGLPTDKFLFLGYPPEKQSHRLTLFRTLPPINRLIGVTYVMYCAPHKLQSVLADLRQVLGDIEISVARELTKVHEEHWSGTLEKAQTHFEQPKGELVLLFRI